MSAIYQRARPIRWDEVVGQEHVKDVLRAALERGRVGHAYLFSGPRGVGKTTTARLIAMSANCEAAGTKPCGECGSCLAVRSGSHPDVLEIDAASNNSVDDVRELREKVSLSAMRGGKKIYILDEAHMMSRAAFNALLKTLEEPPSHVIFVLATTEPEKILPTILSRCQHYRFRRLSEGEIAGKLAGICAREGVQAEGEALQLIGRLADGAMRDGESLLERMLAAGEAITRPGVEAALGLPPSERVADMARALALGDAQPLLAGAGVLYREGYAARTVVEGLKTALRDALHAELGLGEGARLPGAEVPRLLRLQAALDEQEARFARGADLLSLELALTHALLAGEGPLPAATSGALPAAAAAVPNDLSARLGKLERELTALRNSGARSAPVAAPAGEGAGEVRDFNPAARGPRPPVLGPSAPAPAAVTPAAPQGSWQDVLRLADIKMRALLKVARANPVGGGLVIVYDEKHKFHAKQVIEKFDDLAALVQRTFGPIDVELVTPEGSKKKPGRNAAGEMALSVTDLPGTPTAQDAPVSASARPAAVIEAAKPPIRAVPAVPLTATAESDAPSAAAPRDIPDFSPVRGRPTASVSVSQARPEASVTVAPAPWEAPGQPPVPGAPAAELYDPEPTLQEPIWDDAPPPASRPAPPMARPVETAWDQLGGGATAPERDTPEQSRSAALAGDLALVADAAIIKDTAPTRGTVPVGDAAPGPAPQGKAAQMREANVQLRAHPLFQEATRLFSGRVKESGVLKRAKAAAGDTEDSDIDLPEA